MKRIMNSALIVPPMLAIAVMVLFGCNENDNPTDPGSSGTIGIEQTPDALAGAGWQLTGPQSDSGSGNKNLVSMPAGEYTLTWDAVSDYFTPASDTQTLAADGRIDFVGVYTEDQVTLPDNFVAIPAGTFEMGAPSSEVDSDSRERPVHTVTLTRDFHLQATEVTNHQFANMAQWAFDNDHCTATTSSLRDDLDGSDTELLDLDGAHCEISFVDGIFLVDDGREDHPVKDLPWFGAAAYCDWLSLEQGLPRAYDHSTWQCNGGDPYGASGFRLPTEAEWEYACRAGSQTPFNVVGCLDAGIDANFNGEFPYDDCAEGPNEGWTVYTGSYSANAWGLFDMHGNIMEWCNDWSGDYDSAPGTDPTGPADGSVRILRGGEWVNGARYCRSAYRYSHGPTFSNQRFGFRAAITTP